MSLRAPSVAVFAALAAVTLLPGCAALGALTGGGASRDAYELRGNLPPDRAAARSPLHVIVEPPMVSGALDTQRILIRPNRFQAQYLPDGEWTDTPAKMLQTALVREIDGTGAFAYVGREPLGAGGDYALVTEITDFQPELTQGGAVENHLRVSAKMVREADVTVIAQRVFEVRVPASSTATAALVPALDAGMNRITGEMTGWALSVLR